MDFHSFTPGFRSQSGARFSSDRFLSPEDEAVVLFACAWGINKLRNEGERFRSRQFMRLRNQRLNEMKAFLILKALRLNPAGFERWVDADMDGHEFSVNCKRLNVAVHLPAKYEEDIPYAVRWRILKPVKYELQDMQRPVRRAAARRIPRRRRPNTWR